LHDSLVASESDFASAGRSNIEIGLTYQERTEFRFAECAKKFCKLTMRYIEFQSFLIMAAHVHCNIVLSDFCHGRVHSRPSAARATIDAAANGCKQFLRPIT